MSNKIKINIQARHDAIDKTPDSSSGTKARSITSIRVLEIVEISIGKDVCRPWEACLRHVNATRAADLKLGLHSKHHETSNVRVHVIAISRCESGTIDQTH